jgi:phytoene dehydrogenase-like protein
MEDKKARHSMDTSCDVVVVGGGLAGLAAAAFAARAGLRIRVLERSAHLGGRARTRDQDGFLFNVGPHALYRRGAGRAALRELGVAVRGAVPPNAGLAIREGSALGLPVGPGSLLRTRLLPARAKLQVASLLARLRRAVPPVAAGASVEDWLRATALRPEAADLLRAIVRVTTYAHDPARLDAAAALDQLRQGLTGGVLYLDGGWQTLVDGLRRAAEGAGAEIVADARAEAIEHRDGGFAVRTAGAGRLSARALILAVPPDEAARLAGAFSPGLRAAAESAAPVRAASLDLGLRALPRPRSTFALGIDRPLYLSVHSATARLAPAGHALIHVMRYLGPDAPAREDVERELEGLMDVVQPGWRDQVVVRRFVPDLVVAHALPVAGRGLAGRAEVAVPDVPGLFLAGDWVGAEGMLADASLASARRAARLAAGALDEGQRRIA